jgi:hypothetical protein
MTETKVLENLTDEEIELARQDTLNKSEAAEIARKAFIQETYGEGVLRNRPYGVDANKLISALVNHPNAAEKLLELRALQARTDETTASYLLYHREHLRRYDERRRKVNA